MIYPLAIGNFPVCKPLNFQRVCIYIYIIISHYNLIKTFKNIGKSFFLIIYINYIYILNIYIYIYHQKTYPSHIPRESDTDSWGIGLWGPAIRTTLTLHVLPAPTASAPWKLLASPQLPVFRAPDAGAKWSSQGLLLNRKLWLNSQTSEVKKTQH